MIKSNYSFATRDEFEKSFGGKSFKEWLVENNFTDGSAASYASYMNNVDKELLPVIIVKGVNFYGVLKTLMENAPGKALELMDRVQSAISTKKNDANSPKDIGKWYSAFAKYNKFVSLLVDYEDEDEDDVEEDNEAAERPKTEPASEVLSGQTERDAWSNSRFRSKVLRKRLKTQDRLTGPEGKVFYPIRLINKIFKEVDKQFIKQWFESSIDDIDVLTDKGNYKFVDVRMLYIASNGDVTVEIEKDGKEITATLLTHTATDEVVPMKVESKDGITVDHSPAIHNVLIEKSAALKGLAELTPILREYIKKHGLIDANDITQAVFPKLERPLDDLVEKLKKDLELLQTTMSLELMDKEENNKKRANK